MTAGQRDCSLLPVQGRGQLLVLVEVGVTLWVSVSAASACRDQRFGPRGARRRSTWLFTCS